MVNIAIICICDFENWNSSTSLSMGGSSGVIKSILPYIKAEKIYLIGITSKKENLNKEIKLSDNVIIVPIAYIPRGSRIPDRFWTFWYSRNINSILEKYNIYSVYSHSEEIAYWIKPGYTMLYHMHGSTNALAKAKNKLFRNKLLQISWESIRKRSIKNANRIIAIDALCYEITKKQNRANDTILLPNFVDRTIFYKDHSKSKLLENIKENIVLFVGKLEEVKGLELFVEIVNELDKKEKGKWKGVLVGRGSSQKNIEDFIEEKSGKNLFYFPGPVFEQSELRKIYSQSLVLIISSFHEGIPLVVLEALACETPVVTTNVGGIKQLISDGKKCFVIDERAPLLFVERILKIRDTLNDDADEKFRFSVQEASSTINQILTS